jgi:hypothetical protein
LSCIGRRRIWSVNRRNRTMRSPFENPYGWKHGKLKRICGCRNCTLCAELFKRLEETFTYIQRTSCFLCIIIISLYSSKLTNMMRIHSKIKYLSLKSLYVSTTVVLYFSILAISAQVDCSGCTPVFNTIEDTVSVSCEITPAPAFPSYTNGCTGGLYFLRANGYGTQRIVVLK